MNRTGKTLTTSTIGALAAGLAATAVYGLGPAAEATPRPAEAPAVVTAAAPAAATTAAAGKAASSRDWPNLRKGTRGPAVKAVQLLLTDRGHAVKVDGIYGSATDLGVALFQEANKLPPNGVMTDKTFERLVPTVSRGDRGREVRAVQVLLRAHGHRVAVDGVYGPKTRAAVRAVQGEADLARDAVVGPRTWFVLMHVPGC